VPASKPVNNSTPFNPLSGLLPRVATTLSRSGGTGKTLRAGWKKRFWRVTLTGSGMSPGLRISDYPGVTLLLPRRLVRRVFTLSQYFMLCSQDKTVVIWTKDAPTSPWVKTTLDPSVSAVSAPANAGAPAGKFPDVVWRVSWSLAGNILAVSCGDGKVTLWKENLKGSWECVSDMTS